MNTSKNEMGVSVTFPLTADKFAVLLASCAGREADEDDKEMANLLVNTVNKYYEKGKRGVQYMSVHETIERLSGELKSLACEVPAIFELADRWCKLAYDAGREAANTSER